MKQIVAMLILALPTGAVLALLTTPIFCLFRKIFFVPFVRGRLLQKAIRKNHMVTATRGKTWDVYAEQPGAGCIPTNQEMGLYHYWYGGRQYTYRASSYNGLPEEITLYFLKNPRKADTSAEIGLRESNWPLYYIAHMVIWATVAYRVGMCLYNGA